jgi:hypothetical protein
MATQRQRLSATNNKCATVRTEVRAAPEGAPDSEQGLSGAPPDSPVAQMSEAPTVIIQRPGDVAGAPDSVRCAMRQKPPPNHPPFIVSKFSAFTPHTRTIAFNTRHKQEIKSSPKSKDNSNQIVTSERERYLCSFELLRLDRFSSSFFLDSNSIVTKARDTNCVVVLVAT